MIEQNIEKKVYLIDLYKTGKPVEVMVGLSTYSQTGALAVQLFCSKDGILSTEWEGDLKELFTEPYAVITKNTLGFETLPFFKQYVDEEKLPGIGAWLQDNEIATLSEDDKTCPIYRFNIYDALTEEERWSINKRLQEGRLKAPEATYTSGKRKFIHEYIDQLEQCYIISDVIHVTDRFPAWLKQRLRIPDTIKGYKLVLPITGWERMWEEAKAALPESGYPKNLDEAKKRLKEFVDNYVIDVDHRVCVAQGKSGRYMRCGTPIYKEEYKSTPVLMQRIDNNGFLLEEYCACLNPFGEPMNVGPSIEYDDINHCIWYHGYGMVCMRNAKPKITCCYSLYGYLNEYSDDKIEFILPEEYSAAIFHYRDSIARSLQIMHDHKTSEYGSRNEIDKTNNKEAQI